MKVSRDEILDAIEQMMRDCYSADCLCEAFDFNKDHVLPPFLRALGGKPRGLGYFWPVGEIDQRLMFLAFLLTWYDWIEKGMPDDHA
jgi:hypothetical protein